MALLTIDGHTFEGNNISIKGDKLTVDDVIQDTSNINGIRSSETSNSKEEEEVSQSSYKKRINNIQFVKCNCLTKTPEPKYHQNNCPVWLVDNIKKLEVKIMAQYEALTILSLKLNMTGEELEALVDFCEIPLGERLKKINIDMISNIE